MGTQFIGEHLQYGKIGNLFIILSFTAALVSALSYAFQVFRKNDDPLTWNRLARISFIIHGCSVTGIIILLYYIINKHFFEYHFVWQHSSTTLQVKYMWACLWEGQEGSFLVWTFWHVILSIVIIYLIFVYLQGEFS